MKEIDYLSPAFLGLNSMLVKISKRILDGDWTIGSGLCQQSIMEIGQTMDDTSLSFTMLSGKKAVSEI